MGPSVHDRQRAYTETHVRDIDRMIVEINRELFGGEPSEAMRAHFEPELVRLVGLRRRHMRVLHELCD